MSVSQTLDTEFRVNWNMIACGDNPWTNDERIRIRSHKASTSDENPRGSLQQQEPAAIASTTMPSPSGAFVESEFMVEQSVVQVVQRKVFTTPALNEASDA